MSSRNWDLGLNDIFRAIEKIEFYIENFTLDQFEKNELVLDAVIRNLEIIGEASKSIPKAIRLKFPSIPWHHMNGMRNILIHEYFGVDIPTIWYTAKQHLPVLRMQLEEMLLSLQEEG